MPPKPFYGFLSNAYTCALVSPEGSVDWLALPKFDCAAPFCRLLDPSRGGHFGVRPTDRSFTSTQEYLPDTLVLRTAFTTVAGPAELTDALAIGRSLLVRLVDTKIPMSVTCRPRFGYGRSAPAYELTDGGGVFKDPDGLEGLVLRIRGEGVRRSGPDSWLLPPGRHALVLAHTPDLEREGKDLDRDQPDGSAEELVDAAAGYWRDLPRPTGAGRFQEAAQRACLTVRGLTYRTNGGLLAAGTTSLPEAVGQGRNWDYRFVWIRDGAYAAEALLDAGDAVAARRFLEFGLSNVSPAGPPFAATFFRVDGTVSLGERELGWLGGYRSSRPVRDGNAAAGQRQGDLQGDFLWAMWRYVQTTRDSAFAREYASAVTALADWTMRHWSDPDASLWEFRAKDARHTHSLVMAWVALTVAPRILAAAGVTDRSAEYRTEAARVRAYVEAHCVAEVDGDTVYVQTEGGRVLDAATLCLCLYGYAKPDAPRLKATVAALERHLKSGPLMYRYDADMMGKADHPFTLVSFWLARVYILQGRLDEAEAILSGMEERATSLGLFAEHIDIKTGEPRGNFPQLFPHAGLLSAAVELETARRAAH